MSALYLDAGKEAQRCILLDLKQKSGLTWCEIAKLFGVNRSMVFFYYDGTCRMPYSSFIKLCEKAGLNASDYSLKLVEINNKPKSVNMPEMDESLAEFLGALYGDGCLTTNYCVVLTCDAISDRKYVSEVFKLLFKSLFGIEPTLRIKQNAIHCLVYSKAIYTFLSQKGFPVGKKKNRMRIPPEILKNREYSLAFLRGLFDTDGGFHRHHKKSAQIEYTSFSPNFLKQVWELLIKLNFNAKLGRRQVWILDKKEIDNFFEILKSRCYTKLILILFVHQRSRISLLLCP